MRRIQPALAIVGLGIVALVLGPVIAHDDHAPPAGAGGGSLDLNAPRVVSPQTARVIGLETAEVGFGTIEEVIRLGGIVRAAPDRVQVVACAVGGTVASVAVQLADRVKAGEPLAEIASADVARLVADIEKQRAEHERVGTDLIESRAGLEQTRSQLAVVEEQARLAEAELARLESGADAVNANIVSQKRVQAVQARGQVTTVGMVISQIQKELESRSRQLAASAKSIQASERVLQIAGAAALPDSAADLGRVTLTSPADGIITMREAWPGQGVVAGQALLHVVDYSTVQIDGELPESMVDRFSAAGGQTVRIRAHAGAPSAEPVASGEVIAISPLVNQVKRTAHLVISAENSAARLREGMYVDLSVVLRSAVEAVVVPVAAVLTEGPMVFVFVEEDGVYHKHDIVPGIRDDRFVEVLDGLVPGDKVVIRGGHGLTQLRGVGGEAEAPLTGHEGHNH